MTVIAMTKQAEPETISTMKARTMAAYPFFGSYFYQNMDVVITTEVATAATDGKTLYFNPEFMAKFTMDERVFIFCHEILHGVFRHMERGKQYSDTDTSPVPGQKFDKQLANVAADYIINSILKSSNVGLMPEMALYREDINGEMTLEEVYKLLAAEQPPQPPEGPEGHESGQQGGGSGADGDPCDDGDAADDGDGGNQSGAGNKSGTGQGGDDHGGFDVHLEPDEIEAGDPTVKVQSAIQTAKMMGNMPAALQRALNKLLEPTVDWTEQLRRAMEPIAGRDETTYARLSRRKMALYDLAFPTSTGFQTGGTAIIIDTSGSISDTEISKFLGEVSSIMSTCRPEWVKVIWCDSKVAHVDDVEMPEDIEFLTPHGGGGTDMGAALKYIADADDIEPETIVCLTDGWTPWGREPETAQMIWGITDVRMLGRAPFGTQILVEIEDAD